MTKTNVLLTGSQKFINFYFVLSTSVGFPGGSVVKNLPAMQDTWVRSLGQEYPLQKKMVTHSGILAWKIPWTEEPSRLHGVTKESAIVQEPNNNKHLSNANITQLKFSPQRAKVLYMTLKFQQLIDHLCSPQCANIPLDHICKLWDWSQYFRTLWRFFCLS